MNKKLIAIGILGTTVTGFVLPISSFATTFKEHLAQFQNDKKVEDILKIIDESKYSENHKDRLKRAIDDVSKIDKVKTIDDKINILKDSINTVFYKMHEKDISIYMNDDCTSYTMNLVIHSVMSFQNDNYLELQNKPDLLFDVFKNLVDSEEVNQFNKSYINGIYETVNDYPYLTTTNFSKWNNLKSKSDKFYQSIEKKDDGKTDSKKDNESSKEDNKNDEHKDTSKPDEKPSKPDEKPSKPDEGKPETNPDETIKGFPITLNNTDYITKTAFNDSTKKEFLDVHNSFKVATKSINKDNVKKSIDDFLKIRVTKGTWACLGRYDTIQKQFEAIDFLLNKLSKKDRNDLIKYFDNKMTDLYNSKERDKTMCFKLPLDEIELRYKSDDDLMNVIVANGDKTFAYNNAHEGEDNKGAVHVVGNHEDGRKDNGYLPGWKPWKPNPVENLPLPKVYITNIEYKNINGICYKFIITKDINNKIVKTEKFKTDGLYCGLISDNQDTSLYSGSATSMTMNDWYNISAEEDNDTSNLSNKFFYYKLDGTLEYISTGINVSKSMTLTYNQAENLLYQIGLKSGYKFIQDTDKFLIIIDGNPIVINNKKKEYTVDEINKMFNGATKVSLKLMTKDEAEKINQKEKHAVEKVKGFSINGKTIQFNQKPIIINNNMLLPIEEIAKQLNINVSNDNGNYKFEKDSKVVIVQANNNQIKANENTIALTSTPIVQNNSLFMEVKDFLNTFNYTMNLNADNGLVEIK